MSTPSRRARRADARANDAVLLQAAKELFAQRGAEVTYEEIAERAGVGRATVYRHFPTREDLHAAILDGFLDELELRAAAMTTDGSTFSTLFDEALALTRGNLPVIGLSAGAASTESVRQMRKRFETLFETPLRKAQDSGTVRRDIETSDVRLVLSMLSSVTHAIRPADERDRAFQLARAMLISEHPPGRG